MLNRTKHLSNFQFSAGHRDMGARNPIGLLNSKTSLKAAFVLFSCFRVFITAKTVDRRKGEGGRPAHPS